jgi:hypothetical protein
MKKGAKKSSIEGGASLPQSHSHSELLVHLICLEEYSSFPFSSILFSLVIFFGLDSDFSALLSYFYRSYRKQNVGYQAKEPSHLMLFIVLIEIFTLVRKMLHP